MLDPWQVLSRRVLNRTLAYQINREEPPRRDNQKGLLEGKPTVQLNHTLGFPEKSRFLLPKKPQTTKPCLNNACTRMTAISEGAPKHVKIFDSIH